MRSAPPPPDEAERLVTLERYAILDTPPEEAFEAIVRVARALFDAPIGLVSLIDRERQWFKACQGLSFRQTSRDIAFCPHVVHQRSVLYVPDARADVRFDNNELVTQSPGVRFYCGAPLIAPDGTIPGTLDVLDTRPRPDISADQIARLEDLALAVTALLEYGLAQARVREQTPELPQLRSRLAQLYERVDLGIGVTDPSGRIQDANRRMAEWIGVKRRALTGRQLRQWLEHTASPGHPRETHLRLADGERMPVLHTAERVGTEVPENDGPVLHTLADLRPQQIARALQQGRAEVLGRIARRADPAHTLERIADLPALADSRATGYVLVHRDGGEPLVIAPGIARRGMPAGARPDALARALEALDARSREAEAEHMTLAPLERYGPDLAWLVLAAGLRSAMVMPLYSHERAVIGSVGILAPLRHAQPVEPLHAELAEMGQLAAIALQHSSMLERLRWQAYHDQLTGLGNRTLLGERLGAALEEAADPERGMVAVFLFDLDRFKEVNDRAGHAAGDRVLRDLAERLRGMLRTGDTCCRIGRVEFAVFTRIARRGDSHRVAGKIMQAASLPARLTGAGAVTASVGVALCPDHGRDVESLLDAADGAMDRAKYAGGDRWSLPADG